ncbi:hypothetical protein JTB14_034413 [Gonioctena quinquepunctata]|nr:hypothetical protein JTB14_034413 [Gonioctena quinquepunctata]
MILISFGSNLYIIVTQLYKGLTTKKTMVDQWYFMYSFTLILLRLIGVILCGSTVHTQSKKPLSYLISSKSKVYNKEIERLIIQIDCSNNSLSGGQFFNITRGLLFQSKCSSTSAIS